jgi:transposase InsO family protein
MKANYSKFSIEKMCKVFKVSRSGYYSWIKHKPSKWDIENQKILEQIRQIHQESKQIYGSPKITEELRDRKVKVSRPRVARLMKKAQIKSKTVKKFKATTDSAHKYPIVENKLNRNFSVHSIGQVWVSDITYIWTTEGWLYLTIILDLADRKVVGWSLSKSLKAIDTVFPAWHMATMNRPITDQLIFHSDRGVQYACNAFAQLLESYQKVSRSMSRKGDCWDNAVAESFFKSIKTEMIYHCKFKTRKEAKLAVFEYIEIWYNRKRKHSTLGYLSPEEYEKQLLNLSIAA